MAARKRRARRNAPDDAPMRVDVFGTTTSKIPILRNVPFASLVPDRSADYRDAILHGLIDHGLAVVETSEGARFVIRPAPEWFAWVESNPPADGEPIGSDVQAIIYRHAKTGDYMYHVFGGRDVELRTLHGRHALAMDDLPARTGVRMFAVASTVILRHKDGKPLSADFD